MRRKVQRGHSGQVNNTDKVRSCGLSAWVMSNGDVAKCCVCVCACTRVPACVCVSLCV